MQYVTLECAGGVSLKAAVGNDRYFVYPTDTGLVMEGRNLRLHFFKKENAQKFLLLCDNSGVECSPSGDFSREDWEGWVVTEDMPENARRMLLRDWVKLEKK